MIEMNRRWIALLLVCVTGGCASVPTSHFLVPSHTTAAKLQTLSRQSGATVDVLTVNREERVLVLDGSGSGALSGHAIDTDGKEVLADRFTIPFDSLALVYYAGAPKKSIPMAQRLPLKTSYPKLPAAGADERHLSCGDLDVEVQRAGAVRWFARWEGALPYTPHQQLVKHTKNTAIVIAATALFIAAAAGGGAGGLGDSPATPPDQATRGLAAQVGDETLRWAVTSADRRLLGLLRMKRDEHCAARARFADAANDLSILEQIETTIKDRTAGLISEDAQSERQTKWLDQLDSISQSLAVGTAP